MGLVFFFYDQSKLTVPVIKNLVTQNIPTLVPFNPFPYQWPTIPKKNSFVTVLVGDSMVKALGRNANQLRLDLIKYYPGHEFVNYNYGFGATNILSLPKRVNEQTTDDGENYPPILKERFDLIIIESFAYNPLSDFSIQEGLQKQTETLDNAVKQIIKAHPNSVVAIMVTIAPSEEYFAQGVYDLKPEERQKWVEERISYIDNAISFARERNLPLINVYEKSFMEDGKANLKYINPDDFIHPSAEGVRFISQTIADFIYESKIFPE
ncbi:SGNH/GDSL hydrolase family protein [Candidatus Bathyarchaeota archaeon]|nr:SGNH/GDSL hydrolase family protein [Candidatus Bathyarchaeota archaeon]